MNKEQSDEMRLVPSTVRMTVAATQALDEIATEHGLSRAELIRLAVDNRLIEYLDQVRYVEADQGAEIKALLGQTCTAMDRIGRELNRIGVNYNQQVRAMNAGKTVEVKLQLDAVNDLIMQFRDCSEKVGVVLCQLL